MKETLSSFSYLFDLDATYARNNFIELEDHDTSVAGAFRSVGVLLSHSMKEFEYKKGLKSHCPAKSRN